MPTTITGSSITTPALTVSGATNLNGTTTIAAGQFAGGALTLGTAQNTTSGTSIDFTGIPSWVKRVSLLLNRVSTSGTSNFLAQLGSGSVQTTGYLSNAISPTNPVVISSTGFILTGLIVAANSQSGRITFETLGSNIWVATGISVFDVANNSNYSGGSVTLSGTLDRLRLTTVGGADTFDAGSVNILYEG